MPQGDIIALKLGYHTVSYYKLHEYLSILSSNLQLYGVQNRLTVSLTYLNKFIWIRNEVVIVELVADFIF
jgi:hypothetical protein